MSEVPRLSVASQRPSSVASSRRSAPAGSQVPSARPSTHRSGSQASVASGRSGLSAAGVAQLERKKKELQRQLATIEEQFDSVAKRKSGKPKKKKQQGNRVAVGDGSGPQHGLDLSAHTGDSWGAASSPVAWHQRVREKFRPSAGETHLLEPQTVKPGSQVFRIREEEAKRRVQRSRLRPQRAAEAPPKAGAYRRQKVPPTLFPTRYKRGELPCLIEHRAGSNSLAWTTPLESIDYERYLPMFFDGLRERSQPYQFMARQGVTELLKHAKHSPDLILPVLGRIIKPLRLALNTKDSEIVICALHVIQMLAQCDGVGEALIPFYRQLLTVFNLFITKRNNLGDQIDYSQRSGTDLGDAILETLELLERTGGENAFANIKYLVPTYQSSV